MQVPWVTIQGANLFESSLLNDMLVLLWATTLVKCQITSAVYDAANNFTG